MARGKAGRKLWAILRTSGPSTLLLAKALREAGFDAWSPVEIQNRRRPRSKDRFEREVAVMPSYVFVDADRLVELLQIASKPMQTFLRWDAEARRMVAQGQQEPEEVARCDGPDEQGEDVVTDLASTSHAAWAGTLFSGPCGCDNGSGGTRQPKYANGPVRASHSILEVDA